MLFTHLAKSSGLSGQSSKGLQDPSKRYPQASSGIGQAHKEVRGYTNLPTNNLPPYPVSKKSSKPHKLDPERSIWLLFATFSIITVIMGVGNDAKLFWKFKHSNQVQLKVQ